MLSDRRYPCFRNFHSAVSIDVIRMKSYLDSLFDPACVSVGVMIDKHNITAVQLQSGPLREHHLLVGIIMRIEMHQSQRTNVHK